MEEPARNSSINPFLTLESDVLIWPTDSVDTGLKKPKTQQVDLLMKKNILPL